MTVAYGYVFATFSIVKLCHTGIIIKPKHLPSIVAERRLRLFLSSADLGIVDGQEVVVADSSSPKPIVCRIHFNSTME